MTGVQAGDFVVIRGLIGGTAAQSAQVSADQASAAAAAAQAAYQATLALSPASLPLPINKGGTGAITKAAAFLALAPTPQAGKVIGSLDGVNYTTMSAGLAGMYSVVAATALTAATLGYYTTNMTAAKQNITLPDATTCAITPQAVAVDNSTGQYPVPIRNKGGQLLGVVAPGGFAMVALKDNTTVNGVWGVSGTGVEPGLQLVDYTYSATYQMYSLTAMPTFAHTGTALLHFIALASGNGFAVGLVDSADGYVATPVVVSVTNGDYPVEVFQVTATTYAVFYGANKLVIVTVSGSQGSYALAVGTAAQGQSTMGNAMVWMGDSIRTAPKILQLSATVFIAAGRAGTTTSGYAQAYIVSGTSITVGAINTFTNVGLWSSNGDVTLHQITAATCMVSYPTNGNTRSFQVLAVNTGTGVITNNTEYVGPANVLTFPNDKLYVQVSATRYIFVTWDSGSAAGLLAVEVAGTVVTIQATPVTIPTINGYTSSVVAEMTGYNGSRYSPRIFMSGTNVVVRTVEGQFTHECSFTTSGWPTLTAVSNVVNSTGYQYGNGAELFKPGANDYIAHEVVGYAGNAVFDHWYASYSIAGNGVITLNSRTNASDIYALGEVTRAGCLRLANGDHCLTTLKGTAVFKNSSKGIVKRGIITDNTAVPIGVQSLLGTRLIANQGTSYVQANGLNIAITEIAI